MISDKNLIEIEIVKLEAKPWYYLISKFFLMLLKRDLKAIKKEERMVRSLNENKPKKCFASDPEYCDLHCSCKEALQKRSLPNCKCDDVSQCDIWCVAKENYTRAQDQRYGHE